MKLVSKSFVAGASEPGHVKLIPENAEDMWHLYNLIAVGDRVQATTIRKVSFESGGASGGGGESERVKVKLTLVVEATEYDGAAAELRVRGRNMTETEYVKLGGTTRKAPASAATCVHPLTRNADALSCSVSFAGAGAVARGVAGEGRVGCGARGAHRGRVRPGRLR